MFRATLTALLAALALVLAGCAGPAETEDPPQTPGDGGQEPTFQPPPKTVVDRYQNSTDLAGAPNPFVASFEVEAGHDELLVFLHISGVGQYRLTVTDANGTAVYDTGETVSSSPPDSHGGASNPVARHVEPGTHQVHLEWSGIITYHVSVVVKASAMDRDDHHDH